tara:strand:+ start:328 stop:696 length:369 start_codon:yes stop_codon:yes gene_type:complete
MTNEMAHSEIGDYTYLENMSIEAWAWEFTRRNADYREAWKNHVSRISADGKTVNNVIEIDEKEARNVAPFGLLFFRKPGLGLGIRPSFLVPIHQPLHLELQANKTRSTRQIARYNIEQTFMS